MSRQFRIISLYEEIKSQISIYNNLIKNVSALISTLKMLLDLSNKLGLRPRLIKFQGSNTSGISESILMNIYYLLTQLLEKILDINISIDDVKQCGVEKSIQFITKLAEDYDTKDTALLKKLFNKCTNNLCSFFDFVNENYKNLMNFVSNFNRLVDLLGSDARCLQEIDICNLDNSTAFVKSLYESSSALVKLVKFFNNPELKKVEERLLNNNLSFWIFKELRNEFLNLFNIFRDINFPSMSCNDIIVLSGKIRGNLQDFVNKWDKYLDILRRISRNLGFQNIADEIIRRCVSLDFTDNTRVVACVDAIVDNDRIVTQSISRQLSEEEQAILKKLIDVRTMPDKAESVGVIDLFTNNELLILVNLCKKSIINCVFTL